MKKNHINLAHPNKWSDSLASPVESPSVTTEIATGRRTKKLKFEKRGFGVVTIVIIGNYENHKKKQGLQKTRIWVRESITHGEGISTPQSPS